MEKTYIVMNNEADKIYAILDMCPGRFNPNFYPFRDREKVHNSDKASLSKLGKRISPSEWIKLYGVPACLKRLYL